jgi:hypothetical protein
MYSIQSSSLSNKCDIQLHPTYVGLAHPDLSMRFLPVKVLHILEHPDTHSPFMQKVQISSLSSIRVSRNSITNTVDGSSKQDTSKSILEHHYHINQDEKGNGRIRLEFGQPLNRFNLYTNGRYPYVLKHVHFNNKEYLPREMRPMRKDNRLISGERISNHFLGG